MAAQRLSFQTPWLPPWLLGAPLFEDKATSAQISGLLVKLQVGLEKARKLWLKRRPISQSRQDSLLTLSLEGSSHRIRRKARDIIQNEINTRRHFIL